jgi:hypothetical protein
MKAQITIRVRQVEMRHIHACLETQKGSAMRDSANNIKMNLKIYVWGNGQVLRQTFAIYKRRRISAETYGSDPVSHSIPVQATKGIQGSAGITPLILSA